MENQEYSNLVKILEMAQSPQQQEMEQATKYLIVDNIQNGVFYKLLLVAITDQNLNKNINLNACLILKKNVKKNWIEIPLEIQDFLKNEILNVFVKVKSQFILSNLLEVFNELMRKNYIPETWPDFEDNLFKLMQCNQNQTESLYALLCVYSKLTRTRRHSNSQELKIYEQNSIKFLTFLSSLLEPLSMSQQNEINVSFCYIICKIFGNIYMIHMNDYIYNTNNLKLWMSFFIFIIKQTSPQYEKAQIQVYKITNNYYRKFSEVNDISKLQVPQEFYLCWKENYETLIFQIYMEKFYSFKDGQFKKQNYVFFLSRNIREFLKNSQNVQTYKNEILKFFHDKSVELLMYNEDELENYQNNPIDYLNQMDEEYSYNNDRRSSVISFINVIYNQGLLQEMIQILDQIFQNQVKNDLQKEAVFLILQKFFGYRDQSFIKDFVNTIYQTQIIPTLENQQSSGFLKARCCKIVALSGSLITDQNTVQQVVQALCRQLENQEMQVSSIAAISLEKWLVKNKTKEIIQPHIKMLLEIYLKLIENCNLETLIDSFKGLIETFQTEIQPYLEELLKKMVTLVLNINQKIKNQDQQNPEEFELSMISAIETIKQILKGQINPNELKNLFIIMQPLLQKTFETQDIELLIETLQIINIFVFRSEKGKLIPELWLFFEFLCYCQNSIKLNENKNYQNFYLNQLKTIQDQTMDLNESLIQILRNFIDKDINYIIQNQDENGHQYLFLIFNLIKCFQLEEQSEQENQYLDDYNFNSSIYFFETNLVCQLKGVLPNDQLNNIIDQVFQKNLQIQLNNKRGNLIIQNVFWHNLGLFMYYYSDVIMSTHQQIILQIIPQWIESHRQILTYRIRKGSFLGLLKILQMSQNQTLMNIQSSLLELLLLDLVIQRYQYESEVDIGLDDFMDDLDIPVQQIEIKLNTLDNIEKYLVQLSCQNTVDTEILLDYDQEFISEQFSHINSCEQLKITLVNLQMNEQSLNDFINRMFSDEVQEEIKVELKN